MDGITSWTWVSGLCLLLFQFNQFVEGNVIYEYRQLYEGSKCELENGDGEGVCTKVANCPTKLKQIQERKPSQAAGHCGFSNFDEIVCCAVSVLEKSKGLQMRPAEAACEKYNEIVSKIRHPPSPYVFSGVKAQPREFPSMAALGYTVSEDEAVGGIKYDCGGTLISEKHVITAAHCVNNLDERVPVEVMLGTIDITNPKTTGVQRIPVSNVIIHPQYKRSLNYHDVAILELKNSIEFTSWVRPICLATKLPVSQDYFLSVVGWGAVDLDGTKSTKLLKAERLKFVDTNECYQSYKYARAQLPNGLDDGMLCVVDPDTNRKADTCWGDSGGPLLMAVKSLQLVGVTSFGQACGGGTPGVYASIQKYLDWIEDHVWLNSS